MPALNTAMAARKAAKDATTAGRDVPSEAMANSRPEFDIASAKPNAIQRAASFFLS
jgi:hypothetical protein